ncbi:MAG: pteridine-dependent deoxygenase [Xanthomonadales bacterium]|nr:pteridine-dependent deoxygenase [Xanthomonadales bacterium]
MSRSDAPQVALHMSYATGAAGRLLDDPATLAVIGFGRDAPLPASERALRVGLEPLGAAPWEVWRGKAPVRSGREGALAWSTDGEHLFFAVELDEAAHGGIAGATAAAYRQLAAFVGDSATPHVLRLWNYFDAINLGDGDDERYRLFCDGRARGLATADWTHYPAATAIGRRDGVRTLQVYGLASRRPGRPLENPRQVSAWRYPRQYGPTAPVFARGMLEAGGELLISGTAAVIGHASAHPGDLDAQTVETLANIDALVDGSGSAAHGPLRLKAYVRNPADAGRIAAAITPRLEDPADLVLLAGDICRSELLVEVDGVRHAA